MHPLGYTYGCAFVVAALSNTSSILHRRFDLLNRDPGTAARPPLPPPPPPQMQIALLNCGSARMTAFILTMGALWHVIAVIAFCVTLLLVAPTSTRHSAEVGPEGAKLLPTTT